jgi:hypothetical protein
MKLPKSPITAGSEWLGRRNCKSMPGNGLSLDDAEVGARARLRAERDISFILTLDRHRSWHFVKEVPASLGSHFCRNRQTRPCKRHCEKLRRTSIPYQVTFLAPAGADAAARIWAKRTVDGIRDIEVLQWSRLGYFRQPRSFSWVWQRDGTTVASI